MTFFFVRPNWFSELFCSTKKEVKKEVFGHFLESFDKKNCDVFFWPVLPLKVSIYVSIGTQGAFRKILGSVGQKWIPKKYQRWDPLGRQGVESLKGRASPPPLNPPLY